MLNENSIICILFSLCFISSNSLFSLAPQQIARLEKAARDELKKSVPNFNDIFKHIAQLKAGNRTRLATELELALCKKQQQVTQIQQTQQIATLQQEKNKLKQEQKAKKTLAQNVKTLKIDLQQHKQQLQEMQQQCTGAIQKQEAQTKTNQQLQSVVQKYQQDIQNLQQQNSQLQMQQEQLTALQAQHATTQKQLEDKIHTLQNEKTVLTQELEEYKKSMPFKEGEVANVGQQVLIEQEEKLKQEHAQLKEHYAQQEKVLQEHVQETVSLYTQFMIMKDEITQLHEALTSLKDQVYNATQVQAKTTGQEKKKAATELKVRFEDRGGHILRYYEMIDAIKNSFNLTLDTLNKITHISAKLQR